MFRNVLQQFVYIGLHLQNEKIYLTYFHLNFLSHRFQKEYEDQRWLERSTGLSFIGQKIYGTLHLLFLKFRSMF